MKVEKMSQPTSENDMQSKRRAPSSPTMTRIYSYPAPLK